jgi:hypothetical protein
LLFVNSFKKGADTTAPHALRRHFTRPQYRCGDSENMYGVIHTTGLLTLAQLNLNEGTHFF